MEPIPLVPREKEKGNNDVSATLKEVFQTFLGRETFPQNVSRNIQKYKIDDIYIKNNARNVQCATFKQESHKLNYTDIEEKLMYNRGHQLICENFINEEDEMLKERARLKVLKILPNIEARDVLRYGLLTSNDLEFTVPEIAIDCRLQIINQDQYPCNEKLQIVAEGDTKKSVAPRLVKIHKEDEAKSKPMIKTTSGFKILPEKLVFYNYKLDKIHKKRFIVQNLTNTTNQFLIDKEPETKYFTIETSARSFKVAAGMTFPITVLFKTNTYLDVSDIVKFKTAEGINFDGRIYCYRNAPNLRILIFNHSKEGDFRNNILEPNYDIQRAIALNNTIDCGYCFLGSSLKIELNITNEGGKGEFFIMTEEEWYSMNVANIDRDMTLFAGQFKIFPCYMKLEEENSASIFVEFIPVNYGLHLETLYFLCNNNSMEKMEIIGDGIIFEKTFVKVQGVVEMNIDKTCAIRNGVTHMLDLGNLISYHKQSRRITINNDSCMDLHYEMKLFLDEIPTECTMKPDWIALPTSGFMSSYTENDVTFDICCKTYHIGIYNNIFLIIIKNIPKISLEPGKCFNILKNYEKDNLEMVDVVVAKIHLKCFVLPCDIQILPSSYINPKAFKYGDKTQEIITVTSGNNVPLACKWDLHNEIHSTITPIEFVLEPLSRLECLLEINLLDYDNVVLNAELIIEDGMHKAGFLVNILCERPRCILLPFISNIGNVPINVRNEQTLYVINLAHVPMEWLILELAYDNANQNFYLINNIIKPPNGILHNYGEKAYLKYKIFAKIPIVWSSCLILLTKYKDDVSVNSICFINYNVVLPNVEINSDKSEFPILFCDDILHKDITTSHKVYIRNNGFISTTFVWGSPSGNQKDSLNITFSPQSGTIKPGIRMNIDVHVTPFKLGILENIFVPCHIEHLERPIMLKILCLVDDIYFSISMPNNQDTYDVVHWPPTMINDYDFDSHFNYQFDDVIEGEESRIASYYNLISTKSLLTLPHLNLRRTASAISSFHPPSKTTCSCANDTDSTSTINRKRTYLSEFIDSSMILHENMLQFENVPLRTLMKKTFYVKNLTPLNGVVTVQATDFYATNIPEEKMTIANVLYRTKQKKTNEFDDCMNADGFIIVPKPANYSIKGHENVKIDIYVYGHTSGVYCDEVILEVNDCLPFTFNVIAQMIGIPIEFPFALNTINPDPTCRFDTVSYNVSNITRNVKIRNTCTIPLTIMWHAFLKEDESSEFPSHDYFNVIFDMYDPLKGCNMNNFEIIDGQLLLTDEFYGWNNDKVFQVCPREITLEPYESRFIDIEFNPNTLENRDSSSVIGFAVGTIFISKCYLKKSYTFRRWSGEDITKLKLTANLEMPNLKVISDDTTFTAYACDFSIENDCCLMEKQILLQNVSKCVSYINASIKYPFEIKDNFNMSDKILPDDILAITISVKVDYNEIIDMSELFYDLKYTEEHYGKCDKKHMSLTIKKYLTIKQNVMFEKMIPIRFVIYYPKIEVDVTNVNFYMVYIGNIAKCQVILKNRCCQKVPFKVISSSNEVLVWPVCGTLERNTSTQPKYVPITITFKPSDSRTYNENIRICTTLPKLYVDVAVHGTGTRDQNYQD